MGYEISYRGQLKFVEPLNINQLEILNKILGKDVRDNVHCQNILKKLAVRFNNKDYEDLNYIELKLTEDWSGLEHDGSENYNCLCEQINFVIAFVGDIKLAGELEERGEEFGDDSVIKMVDNDAVRIDSNVKKYTFEDLLKVVFCTSFEKNLFDIEMCLTQQEIENHIKDVSTKFLNKLGYEQ